MLADISHALIENLVIGIIVVGALAAAAYFGLRAVGKPVWASNVAGAVIVLGALLLLLWLL